MPRRLGAGVTAINLQASHTAAFLMTDGAMFLPDGTVGDLRNKVAVHEELSLALACAGMATPADLMEASKRYTRSYTQEEFLRLIPALVRDVRQDRGAIDTRGGLPELQVFVAIYSHERRRPEAWICSSDRYCLGTRYQPMSLLSVRHFSSPPVNGSERFPTAPSAVIEAQRRFRWGCDEPGGDAGFFVGGHADLVTVSATSVITQRVAHWHDRIGEPIAI